MAAAGPVDVAGAVALALDLASRTAAGASEIDLARAVCEWAGRHSLPAKVQRVGDIGANVLIGPDLGPDLAFYGHLDTSLRLGPWDDVLLVSDPSDPEPPHCDGDVLWGAGIGVALAPTAAALAVVASLRDATGPGQVGALIASGGTHRAPPPWPAPLGATMHTEMGAGVRAALASGFRPRAVLSPKGGAPGPLWEEPGSVYLAISVTEQFGPSLARPPGAHLVGSPAATAGVIRSIDSWRAARLAECSTRAGQAGSDVAVGALLAGSASKPDLLPDTARVYLYVITLPGEDGGAVAESLRRHLRSDPTLRSDRAVGSDGAGGPDPALGSVDIDVTAYGELPAGSTEPSHPLVASVNAAWERRLPRRDVTGWRGSTDGALLRALGVPTVRAGPELLRHPDDPRVEGVRLADLELFCGIWSDAALTYLDC